MKNKTNTHNPAKPSPQKQQSKLQKFEGTTYITQLQAFKGC